MRKGREDKYGTTNTQIKYKTPNTVKSVFKDSQQANAAVVI